MLAASLTWNRPPATLAVETLGLCSTWLELPIVPRPIHFGRLQGLEHTYINIRIYNPPHIAILAYLCSGRPRYSFKFVNASAIASINNEGSSRAPLLQPLVERILSVMDKFECLYQPSLFRVTSTCGQIPCLKLLLMMELGS